MTKIFRVFALGFALVCLASCGSVSDSARPQITSGDTINDDQVVDEADHDEQGHGNEEADHDDSEKNGLSAHEHGSAELAVAWSENNLIIDLVSPTNNIFGFENEATTEEDKKIVKDRTEALSSPNIMVINIEAGCQLSGGVVTEVVSEGNHAEITASWGFVCEKPDQLKELDAAELFSEFPNLEDIDAEVASESGQSSGELSPSSASLNLQ